MVSVSAVEYVQRLLKEGYSINDIRSHLINSEFSPQEVNSAIDSLHFKKKINITKRILIFSISALLIVGAVSLILIALQSSIDITYYDISSSQNTLSKGGSLVVEHSFVFSGKENTELNLLYEFFSKGYNIYSFEDKILVKPYVTSVLNIPATFGSGDYELKSSFEFEEKRFSDTLYFAVREKSGSKIITEIKKASVDFCPSVCNDLNDCTRDSCVGGVCSFESISFCCGNNICERSESEDSCPDDCVISDVSSEDYLLEAKRLSSTDLDSAARICSKIANKNIYNDCFFEISTNSGNALFCSPISDVDYRDSCYSKIAINRRNKSLCNNIVDRSLRDNCNLLISLT